MRLSRTALLATTLLSGVTLAGPAFAQAAPPPATTPVNPSTQPEVAAAVPAVPAPPAPTSADNGIVITGSRIASPNITSLAPVQVISEQQINQSGAVNIQEVLQQNPAFGSPTFSTTTTAFLTSGAGVASIDLRDLGVNRTLVLINNRRVVGGVQGSPIVDLNNIPTQFLERVDILTGGQSALYGSDAVAGVVNFIYKRNFEGLLLEGQYGLTELGDDQKYQLSATVGSNFADGRGNIMVHAGYSSDKGLLSRERKDTRIDNVSYIVYSYDAADYTRRIQPFFSSYTPQGRFTAGSYTFTYGASGQLQPCFTSNGPACDSQVLNPNGTVKVPRLTTVNGGLGTGPDGFNRQFFRTLSTPVDRYLFAERSHFDVTDNISFFTEATYAKTRASSVIEPFALDSANINPATGDVPIQVTPGGACNPFVPVAICDQAAVAAAGTPFAGLKTITFRRRLSDVGERTATANRNFFRIVAGLEGKLFHDRFSWDIGYNYGESSEAQHSTGQVNVTNFLNALQVVPNGTGGFVCANAVAVSQGCVPLNIFGVNSITPAMLAYINADSQHNFTLKQQVWDANISGNLFDLPAGPLSVAIGAEYRKESSNEDWDALTNAGLNGGNVLPDTQGSFNVKEAYGEVNVPVLKDLPFAKQLNLRAAGRLSDYSTTGSVTTWEIGGDYAPIEDIRFRATLAKAVRAPNIGELFTGLSQTFPLLQDPCSGIGASGGGTLGTNCRAAPGVSANIAANGVFTLTQADRQGISGFNGGNINLRPETGRTFTGGVVISPRSIGFLRNISLSVDYWHIKVTNAITLISRQLILNQCYQNSLASACALITRNPTQIGGASAGSIKFVNDFSINAASMTRSGLDFVFQYHTGLGNFFGSPLTMNARIAYTHLLKGYVIPLPGAAPDRTAGELGGGANGATGTPRDKFTATVGFDSRLWGLNLTGTYIGKAYEDDQFLASLGLGPNAVSVHPFFYLDGQIRFTPTRKYEFYVGVDNITNVAPPLILSGSPNNTTGANTDEAMYDVFGRRYYAGVRLHF